MADVMAAFLRGHQAGQAELEHQQAMEHSKLQQQILKHQIESLKINDQIRARELAAENYKFLSGQPAADIPSDAVTTDQPNLPARNLAGVITAMTAGRLGMGNGNGGADTGTPAPVSATIPAPGAQDVTPGTHPMTAMVPRSVPIPGVEGLGVPGLSLRPRSLEDQIRADIAKKYAEAPFQKMGPGEVIPALGTAPPAGPALRSVGAGGLATSSGQIVVPGRPQAGRSRPVDKLVDGKPQTVLYDPDTKQFTLNGVDVTNRIKPMPRASDTDAADREAQRLWERDFRQYQAEMGQQQRAHAEAMTTWRKQQDLAGPGEETQPPEFTPPTFDEWRAKQAAPTPKRGAAKPGTTPAGGDGLTVVNPKDPTHKYTFPTKEKADAFRKRVGW